MENSDTCIEKEEEENLNDNVLSENESDIDEEETPPSSENDTTQKNLTQGEENSVLIDTIREENRKIKEELEKEIERRILSENRLFCVKTLEENSLPISLCVYLTGKDEEETKRRIEDFSSIVKNTVNFEVSKRLETVKTPRQSKQTLSKREFSRMSLDEMQQLYNADKALYKELKNQ